MEEALLYGPEGSGQQQQEEGQGQMQPPQPPAIGAFGNLYPTLNITPFDTANAIQGMNNALNFFKPPTIQPFSLGNTINTANMSNFPALKGIETNIALLGKGKQAINPFNSGTNASASTAGANTSNSGSTNSSGGSAEGGYDSDMPYTDRLMKVISEQESSNNYLAIGEPVNGDRAYGKYQVMGANIPSWSKEILGNSISAQEFYNSPDMQEKIVQGKMKQYFEQGKSKGLNDDDAARFVAAAWYAGPGVANARVQGGKFVYTDGDLNKQSTDTQGGFPSIKEYGDKIINRMSKYKSSASKSGNGAGVEVIDTLKNSYAGATVIRDNSVLDILSKPTASGRVNSSFGYRDVPGGTAAYNISSKTGQQVNVGTDFFGEVGDPAFAMAGGEITFAGATNDGGGNRVTLKFKHNGADYFVDYNHLNSIGVKRGDILKNGQQLGGIGASGNTTGPHADVAVYRMDGNKRQFIDTSSRFK